MRSGAQQHGLLCRSQNLLSECGLRRRCWPRQWKLWLLQLRTRWGRLVTLGLRGHGGGVTPQTLLVVAGEASADVHVSHVLEQLRTLKPEVRAVGIGGDACQAQGMEILIHNRNLAVMGLTEVVGALWRVRKAYQSVLRAVEDRGIKVALLVDFADFNLRLAGALKKRGVKVIYFITPKVWAWRSSRVRLLQERVDHLLVIFPFEVDYFAQRGVTAHYVGNPTLDQLAQPPQRPHSRTHLNVEGAQPVVALLPGSRRAEISRHLGPMLRAAQLVALKAPGTRFLLPRASTIDAGWLRALLHRAGAGAQVQVVEGQAHTVLSAADAAVVASGTATLETAMVGTPMVVVYKLSLLSAWVAKLFLKLQHVSLVNILMQQEVVKELLQGRCTPQNIARELGILLGQDANAAMRARLAMVRAGLGEPGAALRVAQKVCAVLEGG